MKYSLDEITDRSRNRSAKYDKAGKKFGSQDVILLRIADMDFKTTQPMIDVLKARTEEGIWSYMSRLDSYYEAACGRQERRSGWDTDRSMISFNLGVVPALSSMVYAFTEPGNKVLIQTPVYSEFYDMAESWSREVVESPLKEQNGRWAIDFEDSEEEVKEARIFFLCSPHDPLGIVWAREELERMCNTYIVNNVLTASDEIYSDLVFRGKKHIPTATLPPEIATHVISCISDTKTSNLVGLQISATILPNQKLGVRSDKFWFGLDIHCNNALSTIAMEAAFSEGKEWPEQLLEYIGRNFEFIKDYCAANISQVKPNVSDATYLVWLDCRGLGIGNEELRSFMIHRTGLGLNEGWPSGRSLSGFMRLNAICPRPVPEKAMEQLKHAVDERNA